MEVRSVQSDEWRRRVGVEGTSTDPHGNGQSHEPSRVAGSVSDAVPVEDLGGPEDKQNRSTFAPLPPGARVLLETRDGWAPGTFLGHRAGFEDESFQRLDVALDDGRTFRCAPPACVRPGGAA